MSGSQFLIIIFLLSGPPFLYIALSDGLQPPWYPCNVDVMTSSVKKRNCFIMSFLKVSQMPIFSNQGVKPCLDTFLRHFKWDWQLLIFYYINVHDNFSIELPHIYCSSKLSNITLDNRDINTPKTVPCRHYRDIRLCGRKIPHLSSKLLEHNEMRHKQILQLLTKTEVANLK